jgi:hypothetical protein
MRVSSPRKVGARLGVKVAASQEKTPVEKKTRSKALAPNASLPYASLLSPNSTSSPRSPVERAKSDHFLNVTQKSVADMPLMSPMRVSSPRKAGARLRVKVAASQEKTPVEKKSRSEAKALTCNETNQEATEPNQGKMASPPLWRSNAMEKGASLKSFVVEDWDSDSDSSAPDGGNQEDAFVVERKSGIAKPKSEKKVKNTKLPDKLSKIDEATESNQKMASKKALGASNTGRTNNSESEESSEKNNIKKPASRKIKFIRKSEIEEGRKPENTEGMNSKKTEITPAANSATKLISSGKPHDKSYQAPEIEIEIEVEVGPMDDISPVTQASKYTAKSKRKGSSRTLEAPSL